MRRKTLIQIYTTEVIIRSLHEKYNNLVDSVKIYCSDSLFEVDGLYSDDPIFHELMNDIKMNRLEYRYLESREYTKSEIKQAEYFYMHIPYPWEREPEKDAEYYGTKFEYDDEHQCESCRKQLSDLLFDTRKMGKRHFVTIVPELIVSELVKQIIEEHGLTGCTFATAKDYKGRQSQPYYQLIITNILPPVDPGVRIEAADFPVKQCPSCPYLGFRRSEFIYKRSEFGKQTDFNLTLERFDAYQSREVIVSAKVKELFDKHKIKVYDYEPIHFK